MTVFTYHRQRGFSLAETLVPRVVLSFGALNVVGTQIASHQAKGDAGSQFSIARLVDELAEMMGANKSRSLL